MKTKYLRTILSVAILGASVQSGLSLDEIPSNAISAEKSGKEHILSFRTEEDVQLDGDIKVSQGSNQLESGDFVPFAEIEDVSAAYLFLVDTSDPARKPLVEKHKTWLKELFDKREDHQRFSVMTFDQDLHELVSFGDDDKAEAIKKVDSIETEGLSTWLYQNTLDALDILDKSDATRKVLVLFTDGKSEDNEALHTPVDVIEQARAQRIQIVSVSDPGSTEVRDPDDEEVGMQFFQILSNFAEETGGIATQMGKTSAELSKEFKQTLLGRMESGGQISVSGMRYDEEVKIDAIAEDGAELSGVFTPKKPAVFLSQKLIWAIVAVAALLLALLMVLLFRKRPAPISENISETDPTSIPAPPPAPPRPIYGWLEVFYGDIENRHPLQGSAVTLGRSMSSDIVFENDSVSDNHATVEHRRNGEFMIHDHDSSNGCRVNGELRQSSVIRDGDEITMGDVKMRFVENLIQDGMMDSDPEIDLHPEFDLSSPDSSHPNDFQTRIQD